MAVGSFFYLRNKKDFEMGSAQEMFTERKLKSLHNIHKYDVEKVAFLESYISDIKEQIGILKNEGDKYK